MGRAHAHFGRALEYDRRSSGFGAGTELEPYDAMIAKYTRFAIKQSGNKIAFFDDEIRNQYEKLRRAPTAALQSVVTRIGDMAPAMGELASRRYSIISDVMWPGETALLLGSGQLTDRLSIVSSAGILDGYSVSINITEDNRNKIPRIEATELNDEHKDELAGIELCIVYSGKTNLSEFSELYTKVMGVRDYDGLNNAVANAQDKRVVCISSPMQAYNLNGSYTYQINRLMRLVHATVAFLAQKGMISGGSLVVIDHHLLVDERPDGQHGTNDTRLTLRRFMDDPSVYNLKPLGSGPKASGLLIARADELVSPVLPRHLYAHIREGEIGARLTGRPPKRAKQTTDP